MMPALTSIGRMLRHAPWSWRSSLKPEVRDRDQSRPAGFKIRLISCSHGSCMPTGKCVQIESSRHNRTMHSRRQRRLETVTSACASGVHAGEVLHRLRIDVAGAEVRRGQPTHQRTATRPTPLPKSSSRSPA